MRNVRFSVFLLLFAVAGSALAFLPPDASEREPEIRAQRLKVRKDYEKRLEERQQRAQESYDRATAAIGVPQWQLERTHDGQVVKKVGIVGPKRVSVEKTVQKRILVSIVLFILIGCAVVWVRRATREVEG